MLDDPRIIVMCDYNFTTNGIYTELQMLASDVRNVWRGLVIVTMIVSASDVWWIIDAMTQSDKNRLSWYIYIHLYMLPDKWRYCIVKSY